MIRNCDTCKNKESMSWDRPCCDCVLSNWESANLAADPEASKEPNVIVQHYYHEVEVPKKSKKSKWRKYPDEKPENDAKVIVYAGRYVLAANFTGDRFVTGNGLVTLGVLVTHWRYMPKPPKEYRK